MTFLSKLFYNNVCYKGTALYILFSDSEVPELLPIGYLVGDTMQIGLCLKGMCKTINDCLYCSLGKQCTL